MNTRMIQGVFDDKNASTVGMWAYPDTGAWDPKRNTAEFVGNMSAYAGCGVNAITVGLQGGGPIARDFVHDQPWISSAWNQDGSFDLAWRSRALDVLEAADTAGLVVILQGWYQGQSRRVATTNATVRRTLDEMMALVSQGNFTNVLIEVANEDDTGFNQPLLTPPMMSLNFDYIHAQSQGKLLVSTSFTAHFLGPASVIGGADFELYHCNSLSASEAAAKVKLVESQPAFEAKPKPFVFNECATNLTVMDAAVAAGAGWGYYDQGQNDYAEGFQSPPVNWRVDSSATKIAFFSHLATLTGKSATCAAA